MMPPPYLWISPDEQRIVTAWMALGGDHDTRIVVECSLQHAFVDPKGRLHIIATLMKEQAPDEELSEAHQAVIADVCALRKDRATIVYETVRRFTQRCAASASGAQVVH